MITAVLASPIVALLFARCGAIVAPNAPSFDLIPVKARIDSLNRSYNERFSRLDHQAFRDLYTANACVMPAGMPRVCGRNALADFYWHDGKNTTLHVTMNCEDVSGSTDQIVEIGNYLIGRKGKTTTEKGKYITIWKPEEGLWKIDREIWNSDMPDWTASGDTTSAD